MSTTYNGWTNYATWRVNLEVFDGMTSAEICGELDSYAAGKVLRAYAEDIIEQTTSEGLGRDYAMAFLAEVDWQEIAEHLIGIEA